jgi:hypothetical protein
VLRVYTCTLPHMHIYSLAGVRLAFGLTQEKIDRLRVYTYKGKIDRHVHDHVWAVLRVYT